MPPAKTEKAFTPKRGRPDAKQVAAIEQAILSTARRMFMESGYDAVAMENIAAVTGVSKGTLYARYPSKEALFTTVIQDRVKQWSQEASQEDHLLTDDIKERLLHHGLTVARSLLRPEINAFQRLAIANQDRFPQLSRAMYEAGYLYVVDFISRDIKEAAIRDDMPARDPEGIARMFASAITGWHLQESGAGPVADTDLVRAVEQTVDLFMAGRASW